jgi:beta-phosphoglucomutase-like phosphatase (HAD superfamily)
LVAASRLRLVPQEVIVVEDSVAGVQAARAAGMISIGYAPAEKAKSLCDAGASDVISSFPPDMMSYLQRLSETLPMPQTGD